MYKICINCLSKTRLGVSKVSLCIYRVFVFSVLFGFFWGLIWPFLLITAWQPWFLPVRIE